MARIIQTTKAGREARKGLPMGMGGMSKEQRMAIVATSVAARRANQQNPEKIQARFWSKGNKASGIFKIVNGQLSECWAWIATKHEAGYGQIAVKGRLWRSHILSYTWEKGSIPDGFQIDHLCRTRECVRPDHLEAVTPAINVQRGICASSEKEGCPKGHLYDIVDSAGRRRCRICVRERGRINQQKYYKRLREKYGTTTTADALRANAADSESSA